MKSQKFYIVLLCLVSLTNAQDIQDTTSDVKKSYVIRIVWKDTLENLNFYGFSFASAQGNKTANLSGLALNFGLGGGSMPLSEKTDRNISVNGINISLFMTSTSGTINGVSFGGLFGNYAKVANGMTMGILGTLSKSQNGISLGLLVAQSEYLNGIAIAGLGTYSLNANALQIGGIINGYYRFNGIGIAAANGSDSANTYINGLILGGYNGVDVNGLSLGIVNIGNSWIQLGLVNIGDCIVQIGLVNLDGNRKMGIPLINVNF